MIAEESCITISKQQQQQKKTNPLKISSRLKLRKIKRKFKEKDLRKDRIFNEGKWTDLEHKIFLDTCLKHGNNWPKVNKENFNFYVFIFLS